MVGKCVSKENPKSDLDLGLRVCQNHFSTLRLVVKHEKTKDYYFDEQLNSYYCVEEVT